MENSWQIIDDVKAIHSGNEDEMTAAFEFMTTPMKELIKNYPELEATTLYESVQKWERPFTGDLKLIQVHASFTAS